MTSRTARWREAVADLTAGFCIGASASVLALLVALLADALWSVR